MTLAKTLSQFWMRIQNSLSPWLEEELGEMTEEEQKLITTLGEYDGQGVNSRWREVYRL